MMKLLNLVSMCLFLLNVCWGTSHTRVRLKRQLDLKGLSEKLPVLSTNNDDNFEHKQNLDKLVTSKSKPILRSITPDFMMPQPLKPLNLRLNNYNKPKRPTDDHNKKQEIPPNEKISVLPIDNTKPTVISVYKPKEAVDRDSVAVKVPKVHKEYNDHMYNCTDKNHNHKIDHKITEHSHNVTLPDFPDLQLAITGTKPTTVKPNTLSSDEKPIKKEKCVAEKLQKITANVVKSTESNNTDTSKIISQTQSMKPDMYDNTYTTKFEINIDPDVMTSLVNDPKSKIVIKNHDYEVIFERHNIEPGYLELTVQHYSQNCKEPIENSNKMYVPDTTFIKLTNKNPIENDIDDLCGIKKCDKFPTENKETSDERIWRTWKNAAIHFKTNNIEPIFNIDYTKDVDTKFANQMMLTTCFWCYSPLYRVCCYPMSYGIPYYMYRYCH